MLLQNAYYNLVTVLYQWQILLLQKAGFAKQISRWPTLIQFKQPSDCKPHTIIWMEKLKDTVNSQWFLGNTTINWWWTHFNPLLTLPSSASNSFQDSTNTQWDILIPDLTAVALAHEQAVTGYGRNTQRWILSMGQMVWILQIHGLQHPHIDELERQDRALLHGAFAMALRGGRQFLQKQSSWSLGWRHNQKYHIMCGTGSGQQEDQIQPWT